jgi:hypothetical protein
MSQKHSGVEVMPAVRRDALIQVDHSFHDYERLVLSTYDYYRRVHQIVAPYNSRQNGADTYIPPSRDLFMNNMKVPSDINQHNLLSRMISATIDFYTKNQGKKQLVEPHPSILHSVQFQEKDFKLTKLYNFAWLVPKLNKRLGNVKSLAVLEILNHGKVTPIYFENLPDAQYKYLILRPKMGKTGVPVVRYWEALFFKKSFTYLINHTDSLINPRYAGVI